MATPFAPAPLALELLPGEVLHVECGASRKGFVVRLLQFLAIPLLFAVLMAGLELAPEIPAAEETRPAAASAPDAPKAAPADPAKAKARREAIEANSRHILGWFGGVLFALAVAALANLWLAIRNARYWVTSERVAIRGGGFSQSVLVLDLDKIIAVEASATWLERRFGLLSIELKHAGLTFNPAALRLVRNNSVLQFLDASSPILGQLLNHWLPRDGRARG